MERGLRYPLVVTIAEQVPEKVLSENYSFTVPSPIRIDVDRIISDLSYLRPIALVTLNNEHWVVIHKSIDKKILASGEAGMELATDIMKMFIHEEFPDMWKINFSDFHSIVEKIKAVKALPHEPYLRRSGRVVVSAPMV